MRILWVVMDPKPNKSIEPLKAYLRSLKGDDAKRAFAARCDVSLAHLRMVAYGAKRANESLAINLERETAGAVPVEVTRPDVDWAVIRGRAVPDDCRGTP